MTENEAIKILDTEKHCLKNSTRGLCKINCGECKENIPIAYQEKTYEVAIYALKEIQQYREIGASPERLKELIFEGSAAKRILRHYQEIGSAEECREAMEKQIPKKPVCKPKPYNESVGFNEEWFCPSCGVYIGYFYEGMDEPEQMEYCNECGQHIARDWSDKFDDE